MILSTYRWHRDPHWIPAGRLVGEAKAFFPTLDPVPCALVCWHARAPAAWLRFERSRSTDTLWAAGTWVEPFARGQGLGFELWRRVLARYEPRKVIVRTVSPGGRALVAKLVGAYEDIAFEVRV